MSHFTTLPKKAELNKLSKLQSFSVEYVRSVNFYVWANYYRKKLEHNVFERDRKKTFEEKKIIYEEEEPKEGIKLW